MHKCTLLITTHLATLSHCGWYKGKGSLILNTSVAHGTICHKHYGHWIYRRDLQAVTEDAPVLNRPAPLRRLHDSGAVYKYLDLLTEIRKWLPV